MNGSTLDGVRLATITAIAGTVFIAAGAFWLSFTALSDLARRSGVSAQQAWAWPFIVDGIIVVATVAAVVLTGSRVAWYPWALLFAGASVSVVANSIHAVLAADADVPAALAAAVAAVPPLVLLAITHLTSILMRRPPTPMRVARAERDRRTPEPRSRAHGDRTLRCRAPPPIGLVEPRDRPPARCSSLHRRPLAARHRRTPQLPAPPR